jgi:2-hydroxychromene-2-carboxylate isomerase
VTDPAQMPRVEFFFDYHSPWSYLAFVRLREAAMRTAAQILWKPLDVQRVFAAVPPPAGEGSAAVGGAKGCYLEQDLADWAEFCGIVLRKPTHGKSSPALALRGAVALGAARQIAAYSELVFQAFFAKDQDIADPAAIRGIVAALGLDPESFEERLRAPGTLETIEANADELVRRGGFDVPTMFVGEKMFFGNDRMPLVELALTRAAERPFIAPGAHGQSS